MKMRRGVDHEGTKKTRARKRRGIKHQGTKSTKVRARAGDNRQGKDGDMTGFRYSETRVVSPVPRMP